MHFRAYTGHNKSEYGLLADGDLTFSLVILKDKPPAGVTLSPSKNKINYSDSSAARGNQEFHLMCTQNLLVISFSCSATRPLMT